jgi:hypothetical protein
MVPNALKADVSNNSQLRSFADLKIFKTDKGKFAEIFQKEFEKEVKRWERTLHFLE